MEDIITGIHEIVQGKRFLCLQTESIFEKKEKNGLYSVPKLTHREKEVLSEAATRPTQHKLLRSYL
ncbi:hypothetical protein [Sphingobacterium sp. JB170]|uniref:hypothetical protein n=1 Tax=Sphingobacterium sp. JB170 TaxID=1434842 RepID=UPI00211AB959|nr:hypothetical protein [Sphingobacterium sp. JB170]